MTLHVFNSMAGKKEPFVPLKPGKVGMYVCGVTTYDLCHVGHARVYVVFDTVLRWLRRDHRVHYVRNFTDVDDKIIKRAHEAGEDPLALAARFADEFHVDMDALGVLRPDVEPRVSTHIAEIIAFVADLVAKGAAYALPNGDVYFRVKRFGDRYLELSGRSFEDLQAGARVAVDERKEDPVDFALWKSAKPEEPSWDSPWGKGRPGWHIECSAMSEKHLGITFDIHGGGKDLVFPHHTNEIAQSECRHGAVMARYWLHNGFVSVEAQGDSPDDLVEEIVDDKGKKTKIVKMSKSLGNFFTIREVFKQFTPESLRLLLLSTHYRGPIAFSPRLVDEAEKRVVTIYRARRDAAAHLAVSPAELVVGDAVRQRFPELRSMPEFEAAMDDDFNTAEAMAALESVLGHINMLAGRMKLGMKLVSHAGRPITDEERRRYLSQLLSDLEAMTRFLGVGEGDPSAFLARQRALRMRVRGIDESVVLELLDQRATAKAGKDYAAADAARDRLMRLGVEVRDTPHGVEWTVS